MRSKWVIKITTIFYVGLLQTVFQKCLHLQKTQAHTHNFKTPKGDCRSTAVPLPLGASLQRGRAVHRTTFMNDSATLEVARRRR